MKTHYFGLAGLLALAACTNDPQEEPEMVLAGEYRTTGTIVATNPVRMYTRSGEVNNPALVDNFIRRRVGTNGSGYFMRTDVAITDNRSVTLTIDAQNKATVVSAYPTGSQTSRATVSSRNPQYFVLTNADTTRVMMPAGTPNRCTQLLEQVQTVQPQKRCQAMSPATGYSQLCTFQLVSAITIRNQQLYLPYFSYIIYNKQPSVGDCAAWAGGTTNYFNQALLNQLATGDTLVVQEREIPFTKR